MKKTAKLKVLDRIKKNLSTNQTVFAFNQPTLPALENPQKSDKKCAFCGSENTLFVGKELSGSVAGGVDSKEYKCLKCGNYSVYDTEWG